MGNQRWSSFRYVFRETDLWVAVDAEKHNKAVERFVQERIRYYRQILDQYIIKHPGLEDSLIPVKIPSGAHNIISEMGKAADAAGTGPMSAVAGVVAEFVCNDLIKKFGFKEVVIENGGDIFMKLTSPATISVYAGKSPLSEKIKLVIKPEETPLAVCTSSGTTGHSFSLGKADACMIACRSGALADAYATAFCNEVKNKEMVLEIAEKALKKTDILSVVIILDDKVGLGGTLEIKI
ncbi:MAG TPA: UPF0280 family protein [Bacteroidales bacterium]|nr:UPF0280 family protein [Bacteroidales bacterium]